MLAAGGTPAVNYEVDEEVGVHLPQHSAKPEAHVRFSYFDSTPLQRNLAPEAPVRFETRSHYSYTPLQRDMAPEPRRINGKEIEVRRYTGKDSVEDYLLQFELAARHNYWTDQEKISSLLCTLDGPVLAEIDDITSVSYH